MSIQHVNSISKPLSLRPPQRDSLEILDRICEIIELSKDADLATALTVIQKESSKTPDRDRATRGAGI
jgi:type III restriction enzyme